MRTDFPAPATIRKKYERVERMPGQRRQAESIPFIQSLNSGEVKNHRPVPEVINFCCVSCIVLKLPGESHSRILVRLSSWRYTADFFVSCLQINGDAMDVTRYPL